MTVEELQKRPREVGDKVDRRDEPVIDPSSKRAAPGQGDVPVVPVALRHLDFSLELLRIYYERLFPFLGMFRWLSYRNDPKTSSRSSERDFFLRREFCLVLAGDIFCRYQCFKDAEEFKTKVMQMQPIRMEIGAVYTHPPKNHTTVIKTAYKPLERELVFDIDMDDYDPIRSCCIGSKMCAKCWTFMKVAILIIRRAMVEDFGFKHLLFVYSGRRGVHCWVCDRIARTLTDEQRSGIVEYMSVVNLQANKVRAELRLNGCQELHPSLEAAYGTCLHYFEDGPSCILRAQDILRRDGPHLANILATFDESIQRQVTAFLNSQPTATSAEIWYKLKNMVAERSIGESFKEKQERKVGLKDVVIQFTYPRLDGAVSKQMNHLLKAPFCIHPKTGRVCVPIDPENLDEFDPEQVPTIGRLVEEIDKTGGGSAKETSLQPYLHFFETKFLQPLEREELEQRKTDDHSF